MFNWKYAAFARVFFFFSNLVVKLLLNPILGSFKKAPNSTRFGVLELADCMQAVAECQSGRLVELCNIQRYTQPFAKDGAIDRRQE